MPLIFVDCEADFASPCPNLYSGMTEFGAVEYESRRTFHGTPEGYSMSQPDPHSAIVGVVSSHVDLHSQKIKASIQGRDPDVQHWSETMVGFEKWLKGFTNGNPVFMSDNPAYDWQWINYYFHHTLERNPFGFSARRIGDFYAGLVGDFRRSNEWKKLRVTKHDHNPVNDAMGNCEAFARMLKGDR